MLGLLYTESLLPDDDLIVKGAENIVLTSENDRFYAGSDHSIHSGYGKISGGGGGDIIVVKDADNDNAQAVFHRYRKCG